MLNQDYAISAISRKQSSPIQHKKNQIVSLPCVEAAGRIRVGITCILIWYPGSGTVHWYSGGNIHVYWNSILQHLPLI